MQKQHQRQIYYNTGVHRLETEKIFDNYNMYLARISLYQSKIEDRKVELMPALTSTLSHSPKMHANGSNTEQTVIEWEKDEEIQRYELIIRAAQSKIDLIGQLMKMLNEETREIIRMNKIENRSQFEIGGIMGYSEKTICRKMSAAFRKMDMIYPALEGT